MKDSAEEVKMVRDNYQKSEKDRDELRITMQQTTITFSEES